MAECTCTETPPEQWTEHYGAVDPASQFEWNPDCPEHGETAAADRVLAFLGEYTMREGTDRNQIDLGYGVPLLVSDLHELAYQSKQAKELRGSAPGPAEFEMLGDEFAETEPLTVYEPPKLENVEPHVFVDGREVMGEMVTVDKPPLPGPCPPAPLQFSKALLDREVVDPIVRAYLYEARHQSQDPFTVVNDIAVELSKARQRIRDQLIDVLDNTARPMTFKVTDPPISAQLDAAVDLREASFGDPSAGPYPASVGEVADEVVSWLDGMADRAPGIHEAVANRLGNGC